MINAATRHHDVRPVKFDGTSTWFLHVSTYGEGMDALLRKKEAMKPKLLVDVVAAVVVSVQDGMQHSDLFAHFLKELDIV